MSSPLDEIPTPTGWEKKYDVGSNRTYYIDHARKVTQWDDPRLRHPSIWREQQRQMLDRLTIIFKDAPEDTLRQALIATKFMEFNAVNHVANLGYKKSASIVVGQPTTPSDFSTSSAVSPVMPAPSTTRKPSTTGAMANGDFPNVGQTAASRRASSPKTRSSTTSPQTRNRTSTTEQPKRQTVDPFTLMTMKARYPETAEDVIADVLNQCGQNVDMASRELANMGYAGRQKAVDKHVAQEIKSEEQEKEKKKKVKEEREQHLRQLKTEFESFLDADIAAILKTCGDDLYEARSVLRHREADSKIQALADNEIHATAIVPVVTVQESVTEATIGDTTVIIERERASSTENVMKETVTIKPATKSKAPKEKKTKLPKPEIFSVLDPISKSTGATPSHQATGPQQTTEGWVSLAKGANPSLRLGSDPNLRSGRSLALGPDPSLRRGPNRELRQPLIGHPAPILAVL